MLMLNSHSGPLAQMEMILSDKKQECTEDCFLFQRKGSLTDVIILGGQKEDDSKICDHGDGRKENWTLTGKISIPMDAIALKLIYIVTRQLSGCFLYVQRIAFFDTQTGEVVQYLPSHTEFNCKPLAFPQENILSVHSSPPAPPQKINIGINLQKNISKFMNMVELLPNNLTLEQGKSVRSPSP
ncbi:LOW QUALITY PROTEIN: calicin [Aegotheles albertisi]